MQALLVFLIVAALSLLASSRSLLDPGRFPALAQLAASGLLFLIFGALLGPSLLGVLTARNLESLRPLVALGLGTGGVLLGLNLEPRLLRLLPRPVYAAAVAHAGTAFLFVALPLSVPLLLSMGLRPLVAVGAAALLGAAASLSSGHFAVLGYRNGRLERARGLGVALLTMMDDAVGLGVLALGLVLGATGNAAEGLGLVSLALLLGVACGALLAFLTYSLKDLAEQTTVTLGMVALVGGAAAYLRLSSLLAGVACGATLALMGGRTAERVSRALSRVERPTYLLLVFMVGCHIHARDVSAWALLPAYVGLRFLGKVLGGRFAQRLTAGVLDLPPRFGYALISQGGLALCLVAEYVMLVPGSLSQRVLDVVAVGAVVNEMLAHGAFRHVLAAEPRGPAAPQTPSAGDAGVAA
ncbi:sodium:proton exchanger [Corallococcus sp. AB049A]|uniref:Sodium:proton exchanger n=1 Tax=Corallococcus interemptor TaxID=2316720 RepID=A0A3A8QQJ8_9BACT|nr:MULTISPECIES: sodium:proton exchanger [Corallococcus]RKH51863.1 sodium:proton exchanger [Corallococcus sp. AB050B]RKH71049.1 sodium:proton exchanger [Corallococcus interemptor]RKI62550.1 sodium:proton exchanger [Corallococcus sp. AB049A]